MAKYFFGNKVSNYGEQYGKVDYSTLRKSFDAVLCNDITRVLYGGTFEYELVNGSEFWEDEDGEHFTEIFQYYIIDDFGAKILQDYTNELLYYIEEFDMYVWGVTHYGTAWDNVLTDIDC